MFASVKHRPKTRLCHALKNAVRLNQHRRPVLPCGHSIPLHRPPLDLSTNRFQTLHIHQRRHARLKPRLNQVCEQGVEVEHECRVDGFCESLIVSLLGPVQKHLMVSMPSPPRNLSSPSLRVTPGLASSCSLPPFPLNVKLPVKRDQDRSNVSQFAALEPLNRSSASFGNVTGVINSRRALLWRMRMPV